ncbi:MAG TPA: Uma2 family endonuclease [Chloroflexota bacterium]|jgi:Uma2 family endonuclease
MATEPKLMTAAELEALPAEGMRHELVRGELRAMPPTGAEHGGLEFDLGYCLRRALEENPIGRIVGGETGFRLSRDPDTVRGADVAFIRAERLPGGRLPPGYFDGAPDLAVEIVSPGDTAAEVDEKVRDWLGAGARAVWVVYPVGPSLVVHRPDGTARRHGVEDEVDGGEAFPGLRARVADLLRAPGA